MLQSNFNEGINIYSLFAQKRFKPKLLQAEALYSAGLFEKSLVMFTRCSFQSKSVETNDGIRKCSFAITNFLKNFNFSKVCIKEITKSSSGEYSISSSSIDFLLENKRLLIRLKQVPNSKGVRKLRKYKTDLMFEEVSRTTIYQFKKLFSELTNFLGNNQDGIKGGFQLYCRQRKILASTWSRTTLNNSRQIFL